MKRKNILKLRRNLDSVSSILKQSNLPSLEAEMLLAFVLKKSRVALFTHPEAKVQFADEQRFKELARRRHAGEPIAYIIGEKEFYGLRLKVDRRALIPRPETEELVLAALKLRPRTVADIGTGSGAIALALAVHLPKAKIYAADISEEALDLARENADLLHLSPRIKFLKGNLAEPLPEPVDLIVANLPYIMRAWIVKLPKEVRDFEPEVALDGGEDGLQYYRELFSGAEKKLTSRGKIIYELDGRVLVWQPKALPQA